jgi:hypothetical protein
VCVVCRTFFFSRFFFPQKAFILYLRES